MAYSYPEIRTLKGLHLQQNSFDVPDGALEIAKNVVIDRDGIISKRRGFYRYFVPGSGILNALFNFGGKLIAAYLDKIRYYDDTGTVPNQTGAEGSISLETGVSYAVTAPRVSRSMLAQNNLYWTTDNGVLKLSTLAGSVAKAGAPQGIDITAIFRLNSMASWFEPGKTVGWRVIFGRRDANDNLILSAPSSIVVLNNNAIDATYLGSGAGPYTITVTTTSAHGLQTGNYVNVTTAEAEAIEGISQVTVTSSTEFTYSVATAPSPNAGDLTFGISEKVRLIFGVPSECAATSQGWFYQLYRSGQQDVAIGIVSDFKMIEERTLTASEISNGFAIYDDDVDDILLGAELYTNENTREGELQANFRPPLCNDVALYKNHAIYAACTTRQLLAIDVVAPSNLATGNTVSFTSGATTRTYVARTGVGNTLTCSTSVANSGGAIQITINGHGLSAGWQVYISGATQSSGAAAALADGYYFVKSPAANTFRISTSSGGADVSYTNEYHLYVEGVRESVGGNYIFTLSQSTSPSVQLRDTAEGLVKAVNRDTSSLLYAQYVSGANDVPGKMRFQSKGFIATVYAKASSSTAGLAFSPELPTTDGTVKSTNDVLTHALFSSKLGEAEAVPLVNFFPIGSKNKAILRVAALRDSLIIVKEDGVFRLTGDSVFNFTVTPLDTTVFCVAANSLDVLNNTVTMLSQKGVCSISESAVGIITRKIEDAIQPIVGQTDLSAQTAGVAYESDGLYLLSTTEPTTTTKSKTYCYASDTDEWSSWDTLFTYAIVGPKDTIYYVGTDNIIYRERKLQSRIDYCGQNYSGTLVSVTSDKTGAVVTLPVGVIPQIGDALVYNGSISRISDPPTTAGGNDWNVVFYRQSAMVAGGAVILYSRYEAVIKFAPFHAGLVGRSKHFAQFQAHLRGDEVTRMTIYFTGDTYAGSESVDWVSQTIRAGWGLFPWGLEQWGQPDGINLAVGTGPAPIIRTYVPRFQARGTFIQAVLTHNEAAEAIELQAISWAVRSYGERVTK
jgi:hypothetical protein